MALFWFFQLFSLNVYFGFPYFRPKHH
jgi:hypothetical protein